MGANSETYFKEGLDMGREKRKQQLKEWRNNLPKINEIFENGFLNVEKWFFCYKRLIDFGARQFNLIEIKENEIVLEYTNYSNGEKRLFRNILPRKIKVDGTFQYFFGLWCGDGSGPGRFGLINKNLDLLKFTENYLKTFNQEIKWRLLLSDKNPFVPNLEIEFEKITIVKRMPGNYSIVAYSPNSIFGSFFGYLFDNLDDFLNLLPNREIFFAGLFDAEGN